MFESADRGDLRRMGLLDETPFQVICTHCGSQNPEERPGPGAMVVKPSSPVVTDDSSKIMVPIQST